jgi:bifunctional UDP-N-acetylglucosamine pyrophosphorylase/glucosamine-1-phosphate N-acetyltransferase
VQKQFYEPRGRDGGRENSIMISTPGEGLSALGVEAAVREKVLRFNERWREADQARARMRTLLEQLPAEQGSEVRPIIVAAGEGKRACASGLAVPKPVAEVLGVPTIVRVLRAVKQACNPTQPIVVIVSPETENPIRKALNGEDISWVLQPQALGTGDAVLRARETMRNFQGRALVVWGTQPVLRPETVSLSLKLAQLFPEYSMVLPTAVMPNPYAPVQRDPRGHVCSADETHLERAQAPDLGESNVGMFLLWSETMFRELEELRRLSWKESEGCYERPGGELGFPNEIIRRLAGRPGGVLASPIADWREEKGIKVLPDVLLCEQYLRELEIAKTDED